MSSNLILMYYYCICLLQKLYHTYWISTMMQISKDVGEGNFFSKHLYEAHHSYLIIFPCTCSIWWALANYNYLHSVGQYNCIMYLNTIMPKCKKYWGKGFIFVLRGFIIIIKKKGVFSSTICCSFRPLEPNCLT